MTIQSRLRAAAEGLAARSIEMPLLDAQLLLASILQVSREWLIAHGDEELPAHAETAFQELVARRCAFEPVAYLTGVKEFYGRPFTVDPRVLIPRPETELLVERALTWLRGDARPTPRVADLGTGSGCIAATLALEVPHLQVYAVDISPDALAVARHNLHHLGCQERVALLLGDLLDPLPEAVDLILANLPYVSSEAFPHLPPDVRRYEPETALAAGRDGLDLFRRLAPQLRHHLRPGGAVLLEIGHDQGEAVSCLVRQHLPDAQTVRVYRDWAGLDRLVEARLAPQ